MAVKSGVARYQYQTRTTSPYKTRSMRLPYRSCVSNRVDLLAEDKGESSGVENKDSGGGQ